MTISQEGLLNKKNQFNKLFSLIEKRKKIEHENSAIPRYIQFATDWSFPDSDGWCLLHLAAAINDFDAVKDLVEKKHVDVSHEMPFTSGTAFYVALAYGNMEIAKYLQGKGAKITEINRCWLDEAAAIHFYDDEVVTLLKNNINNLANFDKPSSEPTKTFLDLAAEIGFREILALFDTKVKPLKDILKNRKDNLNLLLHKAVLNNQYETAEFLLRHGVPVDALDESSLTPLQYAIIHGDKKLVNLLLQNGANVNAQDNGGMTPLFRAVVLGKKDFIESLKAAGGDPTITTFHDETIYHAAVKSGIDIEKFFPVNEGLQKLKQQKTLYGQTFEDYRHDKDKINYGQIPLIAKLKYYCLLNYRDQSYLSIDGYCNGLSFLFQYYDSIKQLDRYFAILELILDWDGEKESLQQKPKPPLDTNYETLAEVFEEFLSHATLFQMLTISGAISDPKAGNIDQKDRRTQMSLLGMQVDISMINTQINVTRDQLKEIFNIVNKCPPNTRVDFGGFEHATSFKKESDGTFLYYDCNFAKRLPSGLTPEALTELVINTKYRGHDKKHIFTEKNHDAQSYEVKLQIYHFPWDDYPAKFNYFKDEELPKSKEEALEFCQKSPNHLNHLAIAVLTNSKENIKKLLKDDFCEVDNVVMQLLYSCADMKILDMFLKKNNIKWHDPNTFFRLSQPELYQAVKKIIEQDKSECLHHFFGLAIYNNTPELINELFARNKVDRAETVRKVMQALNSDGVTLDTKNLIYAHYKDVKNAKGQLLIHLAYAELCPKSLSFLLAKDPAALLVKDNNGKSPLHLFFEKIQETDLNFTTPALLQVIDLTFTYLPNKVSINDGDGLLNTLHRLGEPMLSQYVNRVCNAIDNIDKVMSSGSNNGLSLFNYTLLQTFAVKGNAVITEALLKYISNTTINYQDTITRNTVLHTILNHVPKNAEEKKNFLKIIQLLIPRTDLTLKNRWGLTCQDLIEHHLDKDISSLLAIKVPTSSQQISVAAF